MQRTRPWQHSASADNHTPGPGETDSFTGRPGSAMHRYKGQRYRHVESADQPKDPVSVTEAEAAAIDAALARAGSRLNRGKAPPASAAPGKAATNQSMSNKADAARIANDKAANINAAKGPGGSGSGGSGSGGGQVKTNGIPKAPPAKAVSDRAPAKRAPAPAKEEAIPAKVVEEAAPAPPSLAGYDPYQEYPQSEQGEAAPAEDDGWSWDDIMPYAIFSGAPALFQKVPPPPQIPGSTPKQIPGPTAGAPAPTGPAAAPRQIPAVPRLPGPTWAPPVNQPPLNTPASVVRTPGGGIPLGGAPSPAPAPTAAAPAAPRAPITIPKAPTGVAAGAAALRQAAAQTHGMSALDARDVSKDLYAHFFPEDPLGLLPPEAVDEILGPKTATY